MKRLTVSVACGIGLFMALAAILGSGVTTAADAAAIGVTTTSDAIASGDGCSLREAVRAANLGTTVNECTGAPGLDVISLMAGTYVLTLNGTDEDGSLTGDLDITDTLTIVGLGPGTTIIDGNGTDRVWDIHSDATTVVISGMTIFNGSVGGDGGGIRTAAGRLFVVNSVVDENSASDSGGGLFVREGDVTLSGSRVIDNEAVGTLFNQGGGGVGLYQGTVILSSGEIVSNTAIKGGGVMVHGTAGSTVFTQTGDSTIAYNTATGTQYFHGGGGIFAYSGDVSLTGGQVLDNTAQRGGGVFLNSIPAELTLDGGEIVSNTATGITYGAGGGLYVNLGTATLIAGRVVDNFALDDGGGVYIATGNVTLSGGEIISNFAQVSGGGAYIGLGTLTISGGQILSNTAGGDGGGVFVEGAGGMLVQTGSGSTVAYNHSDRGGGIQVQLGGAVLSGGTIHSNTAEISGGGVSVLSEGGVITQTGDSRISQNLAGQYGGGAYVAQGRMVMSGGWLADNRAGDYGGGVYVYQAKGSFSQSGVSTVTRNYAGSYGGGIALYEGSAELSGGSILSNTTDRGGGGVFVHQPEAVFTQTGDSLIAHNVVTSVSILDGGGAIHVYEGRVVLNGGRIIDNSAENGGGLYMIYGSAELGGVEVASNTASLGGGVYVYEGNATLSGGQIVRNTAGHLGGGVFLRETASIFTQTGDSLIGYNVVTGTSPSSGGGGVYLLRGRMSLEGGQILGNTSEGYGGGVFVDWASAGLDVSGGQILSNTAIGNGGGVYVDEGTVRMSGAAVVHNSADRGGGVRNNSGWLSLVNTTVSGNDATASNGGGGVSTGGGTTVLTFTTIASNTSTSGGGGIHRSAGTLILQDVLLAHNSPVNCAATNGGVWISNGHNLEDGTSCGFTEPSDITDTLALIGPLVEESGTLLHLLLEGSPAVEGGICLPSVTTVDQRGMHRPEGVVCDIGAYEVEWLKVYLPLVLRGY